MPRLSPSSKRHTRSFPLRGTSQDISRPGGLVVCSAPEASHGSHQHPNHNPAQTARRLAASAKHARPSVVQHKVCLSTEQSTQTLTTTFHFLEMQKFTCSSDEYYKNPQTQHKLRPKPCPINTRPSTGNRTNIHATIMVRRIHILSFFHASLALHTFRFLRSSSCHFAACFTLNSPWRGQVAHSPSQPIQVSDDEPPSSQINDETGRTAQRDNHLPSRRPTAEISRGRPTRRIRT